MTTADGTVIGTTQIVNNGPVTQRWNLVIVSEGYRASEMGQFATDAQNFANTLFATAPFDTLSKGINVHRVDVSSTDSGADDPTTCSGGTGATVATYFDASFCNNGIRRLLEVNDATVLNVVNAQVPQWNVIIVIVNSSIYGGSGGQVAVLSTAPNAQEIAIHEMGHTAFSLADEYEYYAGCGIDTDRDHHPTAEPSFPNVTIDSNRTSIKWGSLIQSTTAVPTTSNADCTQCDPQASPVPAGTVGAFEGAHYYHCGAYRPEFNCRMRVLGNPFCAVCLRKIRTTLAPFLAPTVTGINPTNGPAAGGTSVIITGTGFTGATGVGFGVTGASSVSVDSDTQITAISPSGSGTVDITVITPAGTSATSSADQFTYM
jgi:IgA Peptidase M64/IPT/TIG domain